MTHPKTQPNEVPADILKEYPNATWNQGDYYGFTEYQLSKCWPSTDPRDKPHNLFICNTCGFRFESLIYGRVLSAPRDIGGPFDEAYESAKVEATQHRRLCGLVATNEIYDRIKRERAKQILKWGDQVHHPLYWLGILMEEVGEVGKALVENKLDEYPDEVIQVAAVCIAMIESHYHPENRWGEPKSLTHSSKRTAQ